MSLRGVGIGMGRRMANPAPSIQRERGQRRAAMCCAAAIMATPPITCGAPLAVTTRTRPSPLSPLAFGVRGGFSFFILRFNPLASPHSGELLLVVNDLAEGDNRLMRVQDLLVYLIPQLNEFPRFAWEKSPQAGVCIPVGSEKSM